MADAEAVMEGVPRADGVRYAGLVLNSRGLDRGGTGGGGPAITDRTRGAIRRVTGKQKG